MGTHLRRPGRLRLNTVNLHLAAFRTKPERHRLRICSYWTRLQLFVSCGGPGQFDSHFQGHDYASRRLTWISHPERQLASDGRLTCADLEIDEAELQSQAD